MSPQESSDAEPSDAHDDESSEAGGKPCKEPIGFPFVILLLEVSLQTQTEKGAFYSQTRGPGNEQFSAFLGYAPFKHPATRQTQVTLAQKGKVFSIQNVKYTNPCAFQDWGNLRNFFWDSP